jgi:hypothetical protein
MLTTVLSEAELSLLASLRKQHVTDPLCSTGQLYVYARVTFDPGRSGIYGPATAAGACHAGMFSQG